VKICFPVSIEDANIDSPGERVFGKALSYIIFDTATDNYEVIPHTPEPDPECKLVEKIQKLNVDVVVCCEMCKPCFDKFPKYNIDMWKCDGSKNIREAYNKFIIGGIFARSAPDPCDCPHTKTNQVTSTMTS
jgi:predicted Fe-Mo cluster-binding NifX family protein